MTFFFPDLAYDPPFIHAVLLNTPGFVLVFLNRNEKIDPDTPRIGQDDEYSSEFPPTHGGLLTSLPPP